MRTAFQAFPYLRMLISAPASAARFTVTTPDLTDSTFPADNFAGSFGCTAANHAPRVHRSGAPVAAKSFADTMFDPDAPTGSGFWHWMNWDIPSTATEFTDGTLAISGTNDAGARGYQAPAHPLATSPTTTESRYWPWILHSWAYPRAPHPQ